MSGASTTHGASPSAALIHGAPPSAALIHGAPPSATVIHGPLPSDAVIHGPLPSDAVIHGLPLSDAVIHGPPPSNAVIHAAPPSSADLGEAPQKPHGSTDALAAPSKLAASCASDPINPEPIALEKEIAPNSSPCPASTKICSSQGRDYLDNEETHVGLLDEIDYDLHMNPNELCDDTIMDTGYSSKDSGDEVVNLVDPVENIPHIGMKFSTEDEAYNYYNTFGRCKGFSIRKSTFAKRGGDIVRRNFVCSKEGFKDMNDKRRMEKEFKRRKVDRVGCWARMTIKKIEDGVWEVIFFDNDHNHALISTPSKVALLRSHCKAHLKPSFKNFINKCHVAGIGAADMVRVMNNTGSISEPNIIPQQCTNHLRKKRKSNVGSECHAIIQYFHKRQTEDCQFYFSMELEDNTCRSIFWADGRARSYLHFSDVVVFDLTYKTNNFKLPFAPFTSVNHHWQSTLFGCALIADEREETFVWLFETRLQCMWGKMPGSIITDQDLAIRNAIKRVFPSTKHRYCIWHIGLHENDNLRSLQQAYPTFDQDYRNWAYFSQNVDDAESRWIALNERYKSDFQEPLIEKQKNQLKAWNLLQNMYDQRYNWVEAHLKDTFFAGMRSSQRSESINSFFDCYVNYMTPLYEFVNKYEQAITDRRRREERDDTLCLRSTPDTHGMHILETYASKVYTQSVFRIFQEEFKGIIHCQHERVSTDRCIKIYKVIARIDSKTSDHLVHCNSEDIVCTCSCAMFETKGILCKHILHIMNSKLKLSTILDRYILARWTLRVRHCSGNVTSNSAPGEGKVTPIEAWMFQASLMDMGEKAIQDRELFDFAKSLLHSFSKKYELVNETRANDISSNQLDSSDSQSLPVNITIHDP